jgi:transcriptional antiterminator RfaH
MKMETTSSPTAELWRGRSDAGWFCIRTHLKREHIAEAHLRKLPGVEVFNPQLRLLRSTRRGRKWFTESLFPNYIFARFVLDAMLEKIRYTPAVKVVLQFGDRVPKIPDPVIEELRQGVTGLSSTVLTDAPIEGEEVEIAKGAFVGTKGMVTQVLPGKQRARILLDVMGRSVPAELSLDCVLFNRRTAARIALEQTESGSAGKPMISESDLTPSTVAPESLGAGEWCGPGGAEKMHRGNLMLAEHV